MHPALIVSLARRLRLAASPSRWPDFAVQRLPDPLTGAA